MCHDVTFVYNVDVSNVSVYFALTFFHGRKKKKTVQNPQFECMDRPTEKKNGNQECALNNYFYRLHCKTARK